MFRRVLIGVFLCVSVLAAKAQFMDADDDAKIGVKVGPGFNWLNGSAFNTPNEKYTPKLRSGLTTSIYVKSRLTDFLHLFDRRHNVENWFFNFEVGAAYRGGNFNYKVNTPSGWISSDSADFNRMPFFWVEMPVYVSWDIQNKQKWEVLAGAKVAYRGSGELYRTNGISPDDQSLEINRTQFSLVAGATYKTKYLGYQLFGSWGINNINKGLVTDQFKYGNNSPDPGTLRNTLKGNIFSYSIDFYVLF